MRVFFLLLMLGTGAALSASEPARPLLPEALAWRLEQPVDVPLILDVRSAEEFGQGHLPQALNIPHDQLAERVAELEPYRDREIVLYCRSGRRSGLAAAVLQEHGFERLRQLEGDFPAWQAAGLPVQNDD